jgi:hypothetical protein
MLKIVWCVMLTASLSLVFIDGTLQENLAVITKISWRIALQNFALLALVAGTYLILSGLHPVFKWSLYDLCQQKGNVPNGTNINFLPLYLPIPYFGVVFGLLLLINLPSLAMFEEKLFREGTEGWKDGIIGSIIFGLVHCLVGVPLGAGIAIIFAGIWFTQQYFVGGIVRSALHHTTYNTIIASLVLLAFFFYGA